MGNFKIQFQSGLPAHGRPCIFLMSDGSLCEGFLHNEGDRLMLTTFNQSAPDGQERITTRADTGDIQGYSDRRTPLVVRDPDSNHTTLLQNALHILCGLHPEITTDEPMDVALRIFDHVQAERLDHQRETEDLRRTIEAQQTLLAKHRR